jgi:hypothetical protein
MSVFRKPVEIIQVLLILDKNNWREDPYSFFKIVSPSVLSRMKDVQEFRENVTEHKMCFDFS